MTTLTQNVLQFGLPAGDVAQCSLWVEYGGTPTATQAATAFDSVFVSSFWPSGAGGGKPYFYSNVVLNQLETRVVQKVDNTVLTTSKKSYTRAGTGTGGTLPNECSACVTLRTALAGASNRGRVYLPPIALGSVDTSGNISTTAVSNLATAFGAACSLMNADVTYTSAQVVIWSRKNLVTTPVITVEVGNVVDAQRRRRNALVETRSSVAV